MSKKNVYKRVICRKCEGLFIVGSKISKPKTIKFKFTHCKEKNIVILVPGD